MCGPVLILSKLRPTGDRVSGPVDVEGGITVEAGPAVDHDAGHARRAGGPHDAVDGERGGRGVNHPDEYGI